MSFHGRLPNTAPGGAECVLRVCFNPPASRPVLPAGEAAAGERPEGGAGHGGRRGPDRHAEGGAGQAAGGAGRHPGSTEGNQQPADGAAGVHERARGFGFAEDARMLRSFSAPPGN